MSRIESLSAHYTRPDWVRRINAMGDSVGGAAHLVPLEPDELDARRRSPRPAASTTSATSTETGARASTRSIDALEATGQAPRARPPDDAAGAAARAAHAAAARAARAASARPSRASAIEAPLVITGPPRSGTSILFELLALDPNARAPLAWEGCTRSAFDGATEAARRAMAECEQEFWADVQPEFAAIHELRSDLPVECVTLTLPSFTGGHWGMVANLPNWAPDYPASMAYHRALLQTLQHGGAAAQLGPEDAALPRVHRPALRHLSGRLGGAHAPRSAQDRALEPQHPRHRALGAQRRGRAPGGRRSGLGDMMIVLAQRRAAGELPDRIVDSHFSDLMADPGRGRGEALRPDGASLPRRARRRDPPLRRGQKPKGKFGRAPYSPEEWGFDRAALRERMRPYTDYYGVALEE